MLRFFADHNFNFDIVRGALRRGDERGIQMDIVVALDVGMESASDPEVLEWCSKESRIVLTHDVNTLVGFAWQRVGAGEPMAGVFATRDDGPVGPVIEDLLLLSECSTQEVWRDQVIYLPLS